MIPPNPPANIGEALGLLRGVRTDILLTERILRRRPPAHQCTIEAGWINEYIERLQLVRDYLESPPAS